MGEVYPEFGVDSMGSYRTDLHFMVLCLSCAVTCPTLLTPGPLQAQQSDRIWGRIHTLSGEVHEGLIRWDRNEGSWADQLDGSKEFTPFQFQDWWNLAHPGDRNRDRVIELAGYRITWDDDEPEFPETHESGIRFGHIARMIVRGDTARLELRSGLVLDLTGGSTDLGGDVREILVQEPQGRVVELAWEDVREVEFLDPPASAQARNERLHGTVELREGPSFTGYIAWDVDEILTSDTLEGEDPDGRGREILFGRISVIRPAGDGAEITLRGGETVVLSGTDDVGDRNDGIQISDPGLGLVVVEWDDVERVQFHPPATRVGLSGFDGGKRLRGTVVTADSTEFTGWIRWDGDEQYTWELLDGQNGDRTFDVEFGKIASIERAFEEVTSVNLGPAGLTVTDGSRVRETLVTLRDGRVLELGGSNDVDQGNDGIFILLDESGQLPDEEEAQWVMVRWEDFRAIRFEEEGGR